MMVISAALVGLLSFCLLPGIFMVSIRLRTWLEDLGFACALSIGLNCFVVMLLCTNGFYMTGTAWIWVICLALTSLVLVITGIRFGSVHGLGEQRFPRVLSWLVAPIFLIVAYKSFLLPYFSWDAVASWNRWARNFALDPGYFEQHQFFYPQYMSWGMSFPYMTAGDPSQEYYSHGFCFFLLLVLYFGISLLARAVDVPPALPFVLLFVSVPFSAFAATGYADIGAAGFSAVAVGLYLQALRRGRQRGQTDDSSPHIVIILAGLAAGTAILFKQSSLPIVVIAPLLCFLGERSFRTALSQTSKYFLGMFLVCLPWVLVSNTLMSGTQLGWVTHGHHGVMSRLEIITAGAATLLFEVTSFWDQIIDLSGLALVAVLAFSGVRRGNASLVLAGSSLFALIIWINTANYDTRGLMPGLVPISVVCIAGLDRLTKRFRSQQQVFAWLGALILLAFLFTEWYPNSRLGGNPLVDWKPGAEWRRTKAFRSRGAKLAVLVPALGDLELWKDSSQEGVVNRKIWGEPMTIASLDPWQIDGGGRWIDQLEPDGKPAWRKGDYLLLTKAQRKAGKPPFPFIDSLLEDECYTWGDWIEQATRQELVRKESSYPNLTVYEFCISPEEDVLDGGGRSELIF